MIWDGLWQVGRGRSEDGHPRPRPARSRTFANRRRTPGFARRRASGPLGAGDWLVRRRGSGSVRRAMRIGRRAARGRTEPHETCTPGFARRRGSGPTGAGDWLRLAPGLGFVRRPDGPVAGGPGAVATATFRTGPHRAAQNLHARVRSAPRPGFGRWGSRDQSVGGCDPSAPYAGPRSSGRGFRRLAGPLPFERQIWHDSKNGPRFARSFDRRIAANPMQGSPISRRCHVLTTLGVNQADPRDRA